MNDVLDGQVFLLVSHNAVVAFAAQRPSVGFGKRRLAERHLPVPGHLQPVGVAQLGRVRRVQGQEPGQPVQREAAVAAAVAVAVDPQQVAAARGQVAMESAALEEVQPPGQSQHAHGIPLRKGFVDGQGQGDGRGAPELLGKLQDLLGCTSQT